MGTTEEMLFQSRLDTNAYSIEQISMPDTLQGDCTGHRNRLMTKKEQSAPAAFANEIKHLLEFKVQLTDRTTYHVEDDSS